MLSILLATCGLISLAGPDQSVTRADLSTYQAAKAKVAHDADAQVKLALWCEAHGLSAERIKHLMLATLINPSNATARGLLGLVSNGEKWQKPEEVKSQLGNDPKAQETLQDYLRRRAATPDKPECPVETCPVVRTGRAKGTGGRPLSRRGSARSQAGGGLEEAGVQKD